MMYITWDDSFSVKNEKIDNQHQNLVNIINRLAESMASGKGNTVLGGIIDELVEYTVIHFKTEEELFELIKYPDTETHKKEHADFIAKVSRFQEGFGRRELGLSVSVMNFLCDWLSNHIKISDKKYSTLLQKATSISLA